jgi:hypothetical protein
VLCPSCVALALQHSIPLPQLVLRLDSRTKAFKPENNICERRLQYSRQRVHSPVVSLPGRSTQSCSGLFLSRHFHRPAPAFVVASASHFSMKSRIEDNRKSRVPLSCPALTTRAWQRHCFIQVQRRSTENKKLTDLPNLKSSQRG